jgi:2-polyprenyl-3-methyl-5-hydroxy-6-metoxy-1,4-benzoquinol methylase
MQVELVNLLRCPKTGKGLALEGAQYIDGRVRSGFLVTECGAHIYPVENFIPRFVPRSNYADNFGIQWNKFRKTQLDSYSGHSISSNRFWNATGWRPEEIAGHWLLDAGCGAGRFAEVALRSGANVVALDYSSAVDACNANLRHHPNLHVVQGDIYALPFARETFAFIYSLGVLQHTPDVARAFAALPPMVAEGGRLCVDYYEKSLKSRLLPKYWLRPLTRRMAKPTLFALLERFVPPMLAMSQTLGRVPLTGKLLKRFVPVANYQGILPLNEAQHREWSLLDTFDWLSPSYDHPQTAATAHLWFEQAGFQEVELLRVGHLVARGRKPVDAVASI